MYEMIPRAIVTVFFSHEGQRLASSSLDIQVYNHVESKVHLISSIRKAITLSLTDGLIGGSYERQGQ